MRVLAVDSVSPHESVAVLADGDVVGEVRLARAGVHSRHLMPAIDFLLRSLDLRAGDLDGFAVTVGPGSFTGLRIGIATVQGLALASGRPCVPLSALDVLLAMGAGTAPTVAALLDTSRREVYGALAGPDAVRIDPVCEAPEAFLARVPAGAAFVGDGAARWAELIRERVPGALLPDVPPFLAATLGRLAGARLAAGEGGGPATLRPLYVRGVHIRPA